VGREGDPGIGGERGQRGGRFARPGGVGEDDGVGVPDGQGVLDPELIAKLGLDARVIRERFDEPRPETVVAAAGIADAEDEDGQRDLDSTVRPDASTSSTVRGMAPRAWVAQLRHGS
jgi:hypothetical protein